MNVNKKIIGSIIGITVVLVLMISIFNTPQQRIARQISLGHKFLEEQRYEEAILTFTKVIEIDPSIKEAYLVLAKVYITQGDYNSAQSILQQGYNATQDNVFMERQISIGYKFLENQQYREAGSFFGKVIEIDSSIKEAYLGMAELYLAQNGYYDALKFLKQGYSATQDEIFMEKIDLIIEEKLQDNRELCENIVKNYKAKEYSKASEMSKSLLDEVSWMMSLCEKDVIYIETEESEIGLYSGEQGGHNITMLYCGDYENKIRQGTGLYVSLNFRGLVYAVGEWKNDKPNGYQKVYYEQDNNISETKGYAVDGIWDGKVELEKQVELQHLGSINRYDSVFNFENGKVKVIEYDEEQNLYMIGKGEGMEYFCEEDELNLIYGMNQFGYGEYFIF